MALNATVLGLISSRKNEILALTRQSATLRLLTFIVQYLENCVGSRERNVLTIGSLPSLLCTHYIVKLLKSKAGGNLVIQYSVLYFIFYVFET